MPRTLKGRICETCVAPMTGEAPKRGPLPSYCSPLCAQKGNCARAKVRRAKARAGLVCEQCGRTFDGAKRRNRFCSTSCSRKCWRASIQAATGSTCG